MPRATRRFLDSHSRPVISRCCPPPGAALIAGADNWSSPDFDWYGYGEGATDRGSNLGDAASAQGAVDEAIGHYQVSLDAYRASGGAHDLVPPLCGMARS